MKKFYMTMVAMLCGVAAMAQENYLYVENIKVDKGTAEVTVDVCMKNSDEVTAAAFNFILPEGLSLKKDRKGNPQATVDEDRKDDHTVMFTDIEGSDNKLIAVYSGSVKNFWPNLNDENDGPIVHIPVVIADPNTDSTYEINLTNVSIATAAGVSVATAETATFTLTVGEGTGINGINALDSKAPVYNVAGQRVSKAQKGVFIQNGKKVAVK
jgi:hypothetical protein